MVFVNTIVILVIIDCKQKLYSHLLITRLISLFDMTPTPHPIQRCSTGKKRVIQGYPGLSRVNIPFMSLSAKAKNESRCC